MLTQVSQLQDRIKELEQEVVTLRQQLVHTETHDLFTGLGNKTALQTDLQYATWVIMCDIDHFKKFNDTYGHLTGDEILKRVAQILKDQMRRTDTVYRYGGEEFTILCKDSTLEDIQEVAERLRSEIQTQMQDYNVTMSFGIGTNNKEADEALYRAKANGRNRVEK